MKVKALNTLRNQLFLCLSSKKISVQPFSHAFCLFVIPKSLAGQKFLGMEKHLIITWCKLGKLSGMFYNFALELFEWCTSISGGVLSRIVVPSFPHIPFVRCTFTIHIATLPANFRRMNFKNFITSCTSHVTGFSIFVFICNVYSEWKNKNMTPYYAIHVFRLTCRRRLTFTGSVRVTCATARHFRFVLPGRSPR
jgi:hypothetical protein